jgi:uncharacterized protein YqeY
MDAGDKLAEDLLAAQKRRDQVAVDALRQLRSAYHNAEIAALGKLDEAAAIKFFQQQLKQRNEAAAVFRQNGRVDLAEKEEAEAVFIKAYLPAAMPAAELDAIAAAAVAEAGEAGFGAAMKIAVAKVAGAASGQDVSAAIKRAMGA